MERVAISKIWRGVFKAPPSVLHNLFLSSFLDIEARQKETEDFKIYPWDLFVYFMSCTLIIVLVHPSMNFMDC